MVGDRFRSWTDNAGGTTRTRINHYSDDSVSPTWTDEGDGTWSKPIAGLAGIAAIQSGPVAGGYTWQVTNLHGDFVAGITNGTAGLAYTSEYNEFGNARNAADTGNRRYGWLGSERRAADTPGGNVLMGARLYSPMAGRFNSVDSVYGGNATAYDYCSGAPMNCVDLDGRRGNRTGVSCSWSTFSKTCTIYLDEWWTQEIISDMNWIGGGGAACAGIGGLLFWLFGIGAGVAAVCAAISGPAYFVAGTLTVIDHWGGNVGIYFRTHYYRFVWWYFGWHYGRWHQSWSYVWHQ